MWRRNVVTQSIISMWLIICLLSNRGDSLVCLLMIRSIYVWWRLLQMFCSSPQFDETIKEDIMVSSELSKNQEGPMHHKMNNKTFEITNNAVRRIDTGSRILLRQMSFASFRQSCLWWRQTDSYIRTILALSFYGWPDFQSNVQLCFCFEKSLS